MSWSGGVGGQVGRWARGWMSGREGHRMDESEWKICGGVG